MIKETYVLTGGYEIPARDCVFYGDPNNLLGCDVYVSSPEGGRVYNPGEWEFIDKEIEVKVNPYRINEMAEYMQAYWKYKMGISAEAMKNLKNFNTNNAGTYLKKLNEEILILESKNPFSYERIPNPSKS